ncbi:tryptophan 7-halogenase [Leptolyngbya cf. ectocarpi LEGE 11479]|uniref:Tryptophan 7-halogenase n=1 Tax=Leptolyngbya cf. ectocarpi LEGE 11479 TaxID=1828722 RepID=A0A929A0C4_LEPEC|nr:tryptophan 7-halogenase [Leptolyngbya ectocarpi]MBE9070834.1 tryptophan 7-halogenase [Leptolyngbya cf. ectocarpi LEGE 11479]
MLTAEVAIAGAGPAGAIAALVLAQAGRLVCLIDDVQPGTPKVGESLPGAARPLLRDLGLLARVEAGGHSPCYGNLSVWGSPQVIETDFIRDPNGLGWHLDRPKFDQSLRQAALEAGVQRQLARVRSAQWSGQDWSVVLTSGQTLTARWLLDATGRRAAVARQLGARRQRDDDLVAVVTWVPSCAEDRDTRTLVEAVPNGWWYTSRLPGAEHQRVVVFHTEPKIASIVRRHPETWLTYLSHAHHVSGLLQRMLTPEQLSAVVAKSRPFVLTEACGARLNRFWGEGWLAVGDAALSFDPLSSQGIFNGLYTGMLAGQTVDAVLAGQENALQGYTQQLESIRAAYLQHHRVFYQAEERWCDRTFWSQR